MARKSVRDLKWDHRYVAVYKCFRKEDRRGEKDVSELIVADSSEIENNPNLNRVINALQKDLILRRVYRHANNPTSRILTFQSEGENQENEGREQIDALLQADSKKQIRERALKLAERYIKIPGVREGVLIFLISKGMPGDGQVEDCIFVFKCDFEEVSQISPDELFRKVEDAIVEHTKKGALYPYFDWGKFDHSAVRVFDEMGETQYWLEFLDLGEPKSEYESLQTATFNLMTLLHPSTISQYQEQLEELPRGRKLADEDRLVKKGDRLDISEIRALNDAVSDRAGEPRVTVGLGEIRISAPLNQYARTWIIAEENDQRYILVKGSTLEHRSKTFSPLDVADFPTLTEAVAELGIEIE